MNNTTTTNVTTRVTRKRNRNKNKKQPVNNSPAPRRRRNRRRGKAGVSAPKVINGGASIAKCTLEYASALVNPFDARQVMPCIPDNIVLPSQKYQTKSRGVFSTGTNGKGFVIFDPFAMAWFDGTITGATTNAPIVYTTSAYASAAYNWLPAGGFPLAGTAVANSNSPYTKALLADAARHIQMRLVAAGIRISYTGSNFRNQGRVILGKYAGNTTIVDGLQAADFLQDNYTTITPISRKSEYVFYTPDDQTFLGYHPAVNYSGVDHHGMFILIDGGDIDVPQSWLFEAVAYFELTGSGLTLSPSHSDIQNMGHVLENLPVKNPTASPKRVEASVFSKIVTQLTSQYGGTMSRLTSMAAQQGLNYLIGNNQTSSSLIPSVEDID